MMKIQITFFQKDNKYKPVSTLLEVESMEYYEQHKAETQTRALLNIAHNRKTTPQELLKQGYTKIKVREYDLEKIKAQQEYQHKVNLIKYIERKRKENEQKAWQPKPFVIQ